MNVLGLESHKNGFTWVILRGKNRGDVAVVATGKEDFPQNFGRPAGLNWVHHEVLDLHRQHGFEAANLKRAEAGQSVNSSILERAEVDGTLQAALFGVGVETISHPWATLARLLGQPNKNTATTFLRTSPLSAGLIANRLPSLGAAILGLDKE